MNNRLLKLTSIALIALFLWTGTGWSVWGDPSSLRLVRFRERRETFHYSGTLRFRDTEWNLEISERAIEGMNATITDQKGGGETPVIRDGVFIYDGYDEIDLRRSILGTDYFKEDRIRRGAAVDWWSEFFNSKRYKRHLRFEKKQRPHSNRDFYEFTVGYDGNVFSEITVSHSDKEPEAVECNSSSFRDVFMDTGLTAAFIEVVLFSELERINGRPVFAENKRGYYREDDRPFEELEKKGTLAHAYTSAEGGEYYYINRPGISEIRTEEEGGLRVCRYDDTDGRIYVSAAANGRAETIVERGKRLVTASDRDVDSVKRLMPELESEAGIAWEPDFAQEVRGEMLALLEEDTGDFRLPRRLFATAVATGQNPLDILRPVFYDYFSLGQEDPVTERVVYDRREKKKNSQWYAEYLERLERRIGEYHIKEALGKIDAEEPDESYSRRQEETDVPAWENRVRKLWNRNSDVFQDLHANLIYREDLAAEREESRTAKDGQVDKDALEADIREALSEDGSGQGMWRFLRHIFGRWREDVQIEIVTLCNYRCKHCLTMPKMTSSLHRNKEMDKEGLKSVIRSLSGTDKICLTGGEPLLYGYVGKGGALKAALASGDGVLSDDLIEVLEYAKDMGIKEVVIDTNGSGFPTEDEKARRYFERFPDNVVFELSLDGEHLDEYNRLYEKEMRDVVRVAELYAKNVVQYNLRLKHTTGTSLDRRDEVKEFLSGCDFEDRVFTKYKEGTDFLGKPTDGAKARLSRTKLQGEAVKYFDTDKGYENYWRMEIGKLVENFFPTNTMLFIGYNQKLYFDAHTGFTVSPPPIAHLGGLAGSSLAETMLSGMVGRYAGFDAHPYLRYLYLAAYFAYTGNDRLRDACLAYAEESGREYERRYSNLTGGVNFSDIVKSGHSCLLARHFRIAVIDNLSFGETPNWLSDIIPVNSGTDVMWELGSKWDIEDHYPYIAPVTDYRKHHDTETHLVAGVMRNFINKTPRQAESMEATADNIMRALEEGKYIDEQTPLIHTGGEGEFSFVFFTKPIGDADTPARRSGVEWADTEMMKGFEKHMRYTIEFFLCEHAMTFYRILTDRLKAYLRQEGDPGKRQFAQGYLDICNKRIERKWQPAYSPIVEGEPDPKAYLIYYAANGLHRNEKYPQRDIEDFEGTMDRIRRGWLQPASGDPIGVTAPMAPVRLNRESSPADRAV